MTKPIDVFNKNIKEVHKLNDTFRYFNSLLSNGIDINGLLRAQIVFAVSALDHYIHEKIIYEIRQILINNKPIPKSFSKLQVGMNSVASTINQSSVDDIIPVIENDLRNKLGWKSFQHPEKLTEGLKMVYDLDFWDSVSQLMARPVKDLKVELGLIVKRRDSIAHEADYDPINCEQYSIDESLVEDSVSFINQFVNTLDTVLS